ncbi:MAG: dTDP-4-dehydrorhamnose reductase [Bacteroidota bacterium]
MKVLVTGAKGQLGSEFQDLAPTSDHRFSFCDIDEMDLSEEASINRYLKLHEIDVIINCGAYTNVDGAEENKSLAHAINAQAPGIIAKHCSRNNVRLIHISTDYVFDGQGHTPITEDDKPNPLSVYGSTKLKGERNIVRELENAYIIRTSWVYSSYGKNFVKTMLRLGKERGSLNVVYDQIGTPTYAHDLAKVIIHILDHWKNKDKPGIYHYANHGAISWYDFAKAIFELGEIDCQVNPIRSSEFPTTAVRPYFSLLSKEKACKTFNLAIPYWKDSLIKCLERMELQKL